MHRLGNSAEQPQRAPSVGDYFVLETNDACWYVSTAMARTIDADLAREPLPEWITFVDLVGARIRVRAACIEALSQMSSEQRRMRRAFQRALKREHADDSADDE
ncbi:MAG TPA: hypothetical protein VFL95_08465 [Gemmatimonadales bacterium]|nr:hypothetical protein [Gemmatimonadales bacterium]